MAGGQADSAADIGMSKRRGGTASETVLPTSAIGIPKKEGEVCG